MNKSGPFIVIEDDKDDQEILESIFRELHYTNDIQFFSDGLLALDYLLNIETEPFIIFSDINMPKLNGIEFRTLLRQSENLKIRSVPCLFFTTSADKKHVADAYADSIQGFFIKSFDYNQLKEEIKAIVEYWQRCVS